MEERSRRWAFVVVFGILSYRVLTLFDGRYFWKPDSFDDPDWMLKFGWTQSASTRRVDWLTNRQK